MTASSIRCAITERDYKIFRFLWKWKILSTAALARRFFRNSKILSGYRRLRRLEANGYIKSIRYEERCDEVWMLTDKAFKLIVPTLGELEHKGFRSEHVYHDYLVTAFHLGEWLTLQPDNTRNYSEQQLRRYHPDVWPDWIPRSSIHRPDGYSAIQKNEGRSIIAFEVELSPKAKHRYEAVVAYYDGHESIQIVLWLVDSATTLKAIRKAFESAQIRSLDKHHFILLSDFQKTGWMSKLVGGRFSGQTPLDLLTSEPLSYPSDSLQHADTFALLDSRKYPVNSSYSFVSEKSSKLTD